MIDHHKLSEKDRLADNRFSPNRIIAQPPLLFSTQMVSHSHSVTPVFSQVLSRSAGLPRNAPASTPSSFCVPSQQPPFATLQDGPTTTELSEGGVDAFHTFLIENRLQNHLRGVSPPSACDGTRMDHHRCSERNSTPTTPWNLKSSNWKGLRVRTSLKSLMFDSVRSLYLCVQTRTNSGVRRLGLSTGPQGARRS